MGNQEFNLPPEQQLTERKGCFTWGRCLGCSVVVMLLICGGGYGLYHWVINKFIQDEPIEIEQLAYTEDEAKAVQSKVEEIGKRSKEEEAELELTEEEINTLVLAEMKKSGSPIEGFRIKFLEEGRVEVSCAMKVKQDKYLNIRATGKLEINNGVVKIAIDKGKVGSIDVPKMYEDQLSQAINNGIKDDPQAKAAIDRIERFIIEEGKAKIKLKKPQAQAEETKTAA